MTVELDCPSLDRIMTLELDYEKRECIVKYNALHVLKVGMVKNNQILTK